MKTRYLTKSKFKLAMECPAKLFYTNKDQYANRSLQDSFLEALAGGGFQIGELAKAYYPDGIDIDTLDHDRALAETAELLKRDTCIIFEAAIKHDNLFARVDILVKEGDEIRIIEVKSKSTHGITDEVFVGSRGEIRSDWKPYVYDIAFQNYIALQAFPNYQIIPYLMLVDKNAVCPTDGLNQKFKLIKNKNGRGYEVQAEILNEEDLNEKLLVEINTEKLCRKIINENRYSYLNNDVTFAELIGHFSDHYKNDVLIEAGINGSCKDCEFKANEAEIEDGLMSGYQQCFKRNLGYKDHDFAEDTIFDLWSLHYLKRNRLIAENRLKLSELSKEDIGAETKKEGEVGLTAYERRWMQIEKSVANDPTYYIDKENLRREMEKWTYPLHFIDFETAQPAIQFTKGSRPYEGIAFQFSHHMVHEDGRIEHKSQYLNTRAGINPNYGFVRKLKEALDNDSGTIFRYAAHENIYLSKIYNQLIADESYIEDRDELCRFIADITQSGSKNERIEGPRNMVDLCELVKKYYYDPFMKGSNSIKQVLPAILNSSDYIKEKYSQPIYGTKEGISSLNFTDWTWIQFEDGQVIDPYQLLPKIFDDLSAGDYEFLNINEELNNGGAAMTAYERLQFENIPDHAREKVEEGLLKYCELDTLAMVIIYEAWEEMLKEKVRKSLVF